MLQMFFWEYNLYLSTYAYTITKHVMHSISDSDSCRSSPCVNNATCYDLIGSYICKCVAGYHGQNCQTKMEVEPEKVCPIITPTTVITYQEVTNHTSCASCPEPTTVALSLSCSESTTVSPCTSCPELSSLVPETSTAYPTQEPEQEVDHCMSAPCLNEGTCHNTTRGRFCECLEYFTGDDCEIGK